MSFHGGKEFVYFLAPKIGGPIKIGVSLEPTVRLTSLMAWSPYELEILVTAPGSWHDEQTIHRAFAEYHSHGEWFRPHPDIFALINEIRATSEIPTRFKWAGGKVRRGLPRKPHGNAIWTPEKRAEHGALIRARYPDIRASRELRPIVTEFLARTGMKPAVLDKQSHCFWGARFLVDGHSIDEGRRAALLNYIRAHDAPKESAA